MKTSLIQLDPAGNAPTITPAIAPPTDLTRHHQLLNREEMGKSYSLVTVNAFASGKDSILPAAPQTFAERPMHAFATGAGQTPAVTVLLHQTHEGVFA